MFALHVHLVFATKHQRRVLISEHLALLAEVFTAVCADFGAALVKSDRDDHYAHLLIEYPPTVHLSKLVNSLKGVSSRRLQQKYQVRTHRGHLWSPSYLTASCGNAPLSIIHQYAISKDDQTEQPSRCSLRLVL